MGENKQRQGLGMLDDLSIQQTTRGREEGGRGGGTGMGEGEGEGGDLCPGDGRDGGKGA